jgi:hypothetical protein
VNVGVGYAISTNQLRNFLGFLKGGRLVDHATLGATVATDEDGRVVVSDILESSDAYRRGLRYDDEIVALAGRTVRTVNAFKNVLGILPAGWRVPLVIRRSGRRMEMLVRLAGLHASTELASIISGEASKPEPEAEPKPKPGPSPESKPRPQPTPEPPPLPEPLRGLYEARNGFTNHHFNGVERDRVAARIATAATAAGTVADGQWTLVGRLVSGEPFRITLSDAKGMIDLPTGTTEVDASGDLDANPSPPGSGGMLAALLLWRRLLREGPAALGRTDYWGTAPLPPSTTGADAAMPELVDVLDSAVSAVEARFAVAADGTVVGIELWPVPDTDPCEVRFTPGNGPPGMPGTIEVRHGNELFGIFHVDDVTIGPPQPAGGNDAPTADDAPGGTS